MNAASVARYLNNLRLDLGLKKLSVHQNTKIEPHPAARGVPLSSRPVIFHKPSLGGYIICWL
jgi:hypothetical protein